MGDPRWLDDREARAWRAYKRMSLLLDAQIARDLSHDAGLSDADYTVLVNLSEAPDQRLRLIELAGRTLWSKSRLSHQLSRMEQRGLVHREAHTDNSRAIDAVLTDDGKRMIEAAAPAHVASVRKHFIDLLTTEQIDLLANVGEQVVDQLRALPTSPAAPPSPPISQP